MSRRLASGATLALMILGGIAWAQPSNRWLFIVETSGDMQPRARAAQQLAAQLVATGTGGQMRAGDTLGLWTFNEKLYAGDFPLQIWTPQGRAAAARGVFDFLRSRKFANAGRLETIFPSMENLIRESPEITIILFTDGTGRMQGTPFDPAINSAWRSWQVQQQKAREPFLTLLRARYGKIVAYSVGTPPWPLQMPPLPPEPKQAQAAPAKAHTARPAPAMAPPLILIGKKTEPSTPVPPPAASPTNAAMPAGATEAAVSKAQPSPPSINSSATPAQSRPVQPIARQSPPAPAVPSGLPGTGPTAAAAASNAMGQAASAESPARSAQPATAVSESAAPRDQTPRPGPIIQSPARVGPVSGKAAPQSGGLRKRYWMAGGALVLAVVGWIFWRARRSSGPTRISLITRSLDAEKK